MKCSQCGKDNRTEADRCENCGSELQLDQAKKDEPGKRSWFGTFAWLAAGAVIILFILISVFFRPGGTTTSASALLRPVWTSPGDTVHIEGVRGQRGSMLAVTKQDLAELTQATASGDNERILELGARGRVFGVAGGTQARVIENSHGALHVRVLQGEYRGNPGWIEEQHVRR